MPDYTMMKCGHIANGTIMGKPICAICMETEQAPLPDLTGRQARCPDCMKSVASDYSLPYFKYRGPGSFDDLNICKCGFHRDLHGKKHLNHEFESRGPMPHDSFYCGCLGWD